MRVIYKYTIEIGGIQKISMPKHSEILSVQVQDGVVRMWVLVYSLNAMITKNVMVIGTGQEIPKEAKDEYYVSTFQLGSFVGHVFAWGN